MADTERVGASGGAAVTLPHERRNAVVRTARFLEQMRSGTIGNIPVEIRRQAGDLLRHYPTQIDADRWEKQDADKEHESK